MSEELNVKSKNKLNKKVLLSVAIVIAILTVLAIVLIVPNMVRGEEVEKQLSLGDKYLSELNYEQAEATYLAVLKIDPKCEDAYIGLANVYIATGQYEKAEEILKKAEEELGEGIEEIQEKQNEVDEMKKEQEPTDVIEPTVTNTPISIVTSTPEPTATNIPKPTETVKEVSKVEVQHSYDEGEHGIFSGVTETGEVVWEYKTEYYEPAQLDHISEIGVYNNTYYLSESGSIVAIDLQTGIVQWENNDSESAYIDSTFGEQGELYLCGYEDTDFFAIDNKGTTLKKIESFDEDVYGAYEIEYLGNMVKVTCESTDYGYDKVEVYVILRNYSYVVALKNDFAGEYIIPEDAQIEPEEMEEISRIAGISFYIPMVTPEATVTSVPEPIVTSIPTQIATNTPMPTATNTPKPTATNMPTAKPEDSSNDNKSSNVVDHTEEGLYKKYDLGGVTISLLDQSDLSGKNPENTEEEYQKAERQEHLDYIEKKYNVNLEFVKVPTDDWDNMPEEIVSAYISGNPVADVMCAYYQQMDTYIANDILYDMTDAFAKSDIFNPNAYFSWIGKQWGVSLGMSGEGLYYNKTMIEKVGMEYTPAEMFDMGLWDYDNCYEYLKELKSKMDEDEYPLFVSPYYWALWATHANGVKIWKDNGNLGYIEEPFLETMEFLQKLVNEGIAAIPDFGENWDGTISYNNWGYPGSTFDEGHTVAISHRAAWQAAGLVDKFELGYVPYPWGSNISINKKIIGQKGAYKTLDSNYMGSYYDGMAMVLVKGIEKKADPMDVMVMLTELMGWDSLKSDYIIDEDFRRCPWVEDGIDDDLYYFQHDRATGEFYNSISSIEFDWKNNINKTIYQNLDIHSNFESYYQADMAKMIEAGYATLDMVIPPSQ